MDKTFFDLGEHYEGLKTLADYPDLYAVFDGHSLGVLTGNGMMSVQGVKVALGGEPGWFDRVVSESKVRRATLKDFDFFRVHPPKEYSDTPKWSGWVWDETRSEYRLG